MLDCVVKVAIVFSLIFLDSFSLCLSKLNYLCITVFYYRLDIGSRALSKTKSPVTLVALIEVVINGTKTLGFWFDLCSTSIFLEKNT